jgi:hypothetical protein
MEDREHFPANREAEPRAARMPVARRVYPVEPLEDPVQVAGRYARAFVGDAHGDHRRIP